MEFKDDILDIYFDILELQKLADTKGLTTDFTVNRGFEKVKNLLKRTIHNFGPDYVVK